MPSWSIHIALAKRLKNKYHLTDDFIIGNIIPDATNGFIIPNISTIIDYSKTHYNLEGQNRFPKINLDCFLNDYQEKLDNPIILGSYIHLLTDSFYNSYFRKTHVGENRSAILNNGSVCDITPWKLKQEEFSKFGSYLAYLGKLGSEINKTNQTCEYIKALTYQLTKQDIDIIIDKVNEFINEDLKEIPQYKMFTQEELEKLFEDCYCYLEEMIDTLWKGKKYVRNKI